jgi:hypothetical protein
MLVPLLFRAVAVSNQIAKAPAKGAGPEELKNLDFFQKS